MCQGCFVYGINSSGVESHTTGELYLLPGPALDRIPVGSGGNQDPGTTEAPLQPAPPAGRGLTRAATREAAIQTARHSPRLADWPAASAAPRGLPGAVVPAGAARRTPAPRPARGGRPAAPAGGGARAGREPLPPASPPPESVPDGEEGRGRTAPVPPRFSGVRGGSPCRRARLRPPCSADPSPLPER